MRVHAVVSQYGPNSFGVHSPQVPALFAGGGTLQDYTGQALVALLAEAGAPSEYDLVQHRQEYHNVEGREWFIRLCLETHARRAGERHQTLYMLRSLLDVTLQPVDGAAKALTGEALFIVARLDDTAGWLSEQMDASGAATIVAREGDDRLWLLDVAKGELATGMRVPDQVTVRELMQQLGATEEPEVFDFLTEKVVTESRVRQLVSV